MYEYQRFKSRLAFLVATCLVVVCCPADADIAIVPSIDGTIRDGLYQPKDGVPDDLFRRGIVQVVNTNRAHRPFEDRGILEFDISAANTIVLTANLVLPVYNSAGPYPFSIDVYTYSGNGVMSLSDFSSGQYTGSFSYSGESISIFDVTSTILSAQAAGEQFVGFNLRLTVPLDGSSISFRSLEFGPPATLRLETVPEPGGSFSLLTMLIAAGLKRTKRS